MCSLSLNNPKDIVALHVKSEWKKACKLHMTTIIKSLTLGILLVAPAPDAWATRKFNPDTECTSRDRGPYPWNFRQIVEDHINKGFFDPNSIIDLEIFKPAPGWWTTAAFKKTRKNTKCYWYIPFMANGKNRMGGYVGRKAYGLWVKNSIVVHSLERSGIDQRVNLSGERSFSEELDKLSADERAKVLALAAASAAEHDESSAPAYLGELKELAKLRDAGIISEEEFQQKKTEILGLKKNDGGR